LKYLPFESEDQMRQEEDACRQSSLERTVSA